MIEEKVKVPRSELVRQLVARDGLECQFPGANHILDLNITEGPLEPTIDHHIPQWYGKENGWTQEQIWDLSNLKLMCKAHNAKKGERVPNEDGSLPPRVESTFKFRRQKRAQRPEICTSCKSGRLLGPNEWCNACGSGPNPGRYPKWRQMSVRDCDHDLFYCVSCTIWFPEQRRSVIDALITGGNGYE